MSGLALFLGVAAFFLPGVPAAQKYLKLDWLQAPADYGIVGLAVLGWAVALSLVWWLIPPVDEMPPVSGLQAGRRAGPGRADAGL